MAKKYLSIDKVPKRIRKKLSRYVTNVGGSTFAITGLPPELTGGLLARYSRASTGLQLTLVNEFLDKNGNPSQEKGSEIIDRVLNAFGDDSVGELEGAHAGIEDISQLATKGIEDRRIGGSPIEQSTRYVKYDVRDEQGRWRYLRPREIMDSGFGERFEQVNDRAFEVYQEGIIRLIEHFKKEFPRNNFQINVERDKKTLKAYESELVGDSERRAFNNAYSFTIRCAALDVGRCVLPSSTLTHMGLHGNGKFFTHVISHLKSSELIEESARGADLETELNKIIPTFIKRNKMNPKIKETHQKMRKIAYTYFAGIKPQDNRVTLMPRADYFHEVIASSIFPYTNISLPQIHERLDELPYETRMEIFNSYVGKRESRRDRTGRGLEAGYPLTFDLVGGFAEYRDLERHRILTQQRQSLTTELGFVLPPEMGIVGLEREVNEVVGLIEELNSDLRHAGLGVAAQYATLFNHRIRFMLGMNLREFQHLAELRTQPAGHFSYRSMVMEMANKIRERYPWSQKAYGFVDYSDPGNKISRAREQSKIAGKNIAAGIDGGVDF
jgi:thymidylate synthase ThyX